MRYQIFISYRRDGGETLARLLHDKLTDMGYNVFYDHESLRSGVFDDELLNVIDGCTDVLAVLSPGCLDRCNDPSDWVRTELSHALQAQKNIVPIMMRGFSFDDVNLPEDIMQIKFHNGIEANMEFFPAVMEKLTKKLIHSKPYWRLKDENDHGTQIKILTGWRRTACELLLIMPLVIPYCLRRFYRKVDFFPSFLNDYFMMFKEWSLVSYIVYNVIVIIALYLILNRSYVLKRSLSGSDGIDFSDFEIGLDDFLNLLAEKENFGKLNIRRNENKEDSSDYVLSVESKGLKILSLDGEKPDYILLNYPVYEGKLQPLYLTRAATISSAGQFLKEQGFDLVWQIDNRACYQNGEWKILLLFGGMAKCLLVMEMMRGEQTSMMEEASQEAEQKLLGTEFKKMIDEMKEEIKADFTEKKNAEKDEDLKNENDNSKVDGE